LEIHLKEYAAQRSFNRDYESAKESKDLRQSVLKELKHRHDAQYQYVDRDCFAEKKAEREESNRQELEEYDRRWADKNAELERKHGEQLEHFDKNWNEERPAKYRKPSAKLLQLTEIERQAGNIDNFEEAAIIREAREAQEAIESEMAQDALVQDYETAKQKLLQNQEEEKQLFEAKRVHWREMLVARHQVEMLAFDKREKVLGVKAEQFTKPRESVLDPASQEGHDVPCVHAQRARSRECDQHLLPPLLPPTDPSIRDKREKQKRKRKERVSKFQERLEKKMKEKDRSGPPSGAGSPRSSEKEQRTRPIKARSVNDGLGSEEVVVINGEGEDGGPGRNPFNLTQNDKFET
jgi:hypothetical protein